MLKSIEELRAQRNLIQKHLEWLDVQIQRAGKNQEASQSADAIGKASINPISADSKDQNLGGTTALPYSAVEQNIPIEASFTNSSSISDIKRVKIGCFAFFAVATLLFLFLLFGLPYLLD